MEIIKTRNTILLAILAGLLTFCTPVTKLTNSWAVQDGAKTYKNLAVVAMTKNPAHRETVERAVAMELRSRNIKAIGTTGIFPFADKQDELTEWGLDLSKENITKVIREKTAANEIDGLMIIAILDKKKEMERRGGNFGVSMAYPVSTYPYYGYGPGGYYSYAYSEVYTPSYDVEIITFIVETNIYDMASESLIWSGVTETTDPKTVTGESAAFAKIIADQMVADGAVKP